METISEIIPFAKEMLHQRPSRGMLKIYMLGSTLAMLGVVGGLVETVLLPFTELEAVEDMPAEQIKEEEEEKKEKKQAVKSESTVVHPEIEDDMPEAVAIEVKGKHQVVAGRRNSSVRLHAS